MLSENDLHRYSRQVIIKEFDEEIPKIIKTKCLIVGAGDWVALLLYAAVQVLDILKSMTRIL